MSTVESCLVWSNLEISGQLSAEAARIFSGRSAFMTFLSRALAACLEKFGLIIIIDTSKQAVVDEIKKKKKNAAEILFIGNSRGTGFSTLLFILCFCLLST